MRLYAKSFGITIHNYTLMSNHYHLLIEITQSNLTEFMRQLGKIVQAYQQGYSQHSIAKVLGLNQATVQWIIKRAKV